MSLEVLAIILVFAAVALIVMGPVGILLSISAIRNVSRLKARVEELEKKLEQVAIQKAPLQRMVSPEGEVLADHCKDAIPVGPAPVEAAVKVSPTATSSFAEAVRPPRRPAQRPSIETVGIWAASIFGGIFLLIAAVFAYKLAIERGFLGPLVRYVMGLGLGVSGLVVAEKLWAKYRIPASALAGAAIGGLYAALYAGHSVYGLVGVTPTFGLMTGVTTVGVLMAIRRASQFVAILGLVGGFLTPILLSTGENRALALFSYIAILDMGLSLVAWRRGWWVLVALAGLATFSIHLGWGIKFYAAEQVPMALGSSVILAALFLVTAWVHQASVSVAIAAAAGLLLAPLTATAYVVPILSWQANTSASIGPAWLNPILAASYLLLIGAAIHGLAAVRRWSLLAVAGAGALLPGLTLGAAGWADRRSDVYAPFFFIAVWGMPLVAWIAAAIIPWHPKQVVPTRQPRALYPGPGLGATGALAVSAIATLLIVFRNPSPHTLILATISLAVPAWLTAIRPGPVWSSLVGMFGVGLTIAMGAGRSENLLLPGFLAFVCFLSPPFLLRLLHPESSFTERLSPWLSSALIGPVLFLPLYVAWDKQLGKDAIGGLPVILGCGTLAGAVMLRNRFRAVPENALAIYVAVTLLFACVAIPVQLNNEWWTVGWALEGAALAWLSCRIRSRWIVVFSIVLFGLVGVRLLFNVEVFHYHPIEVATLWNWTLYGYGLPAVSLLVGAFWFQRRNELSVAEGVDLGRHGWARYLPKGCAILSILVLFALLNLEVSYAFAEGTNLSFHDRTLTAQMVRSVSWAVFGLILLLAAMNRRWMRLMGLGFLMLAALKVFLLDLRTLTGIARVGCLFGVAVALILGALALQRLILKAGPSASRHTDTNP